MQPDFACVPECSRAVAARAAVSVHPAVLLGRLPAPPAEAGRGGAGSRPLAHRLLPGNISAAEDRWESCRLTRLLLSLADGGGMQAYLGRAATTDQHGLSGELLWLWLAGTTSWLACSFVSELGCMLWFTSVKVGGLSDHSC